MSTPSSTKYFIKTFFMAHYTFFSLALLLAFASTCKSSNISSLYFFGDSLLDTGTNNYITTGARADHPPYGRDFPGHIATGRWTNGLMVPDLLAAQLSIKQFVPPFLDPKISEGDIKTGVNFASAGAGYDEMTSMLTGTLPVSKQMQNYNGYVKRLTALVGDVESKRIIGDSVTMFSSGSNDFAISFFPPGSPRQILGLNGYISLLLNVLKNSLKQLYDSGARKFIIAGVPPFYCMPGNVAGRLNPFGCTLETISPATAYNSALKNLLPQLERSLTGSRIMYMDFHDNLLDMINNPSKYGFTETKRGCCGITGVSEIGPSCNLFTPVCPDASKFAFFDGVHPTEKVYRVFADQIMKDIIPQF